MNSLKCILICMFLVTLTNESCLRTYKLESGEIVRFISILKNKIKWKLILINIDKK